MTILQGHEPISATLIATVTSRILNPGKRFSLRALFPITRFKNGSDPNVQRENGRRYPSFDLNGLAHSEGAGGQSSGI